MAEDDRLFDVPPDWAEHWNDDFPEFKMEHRREYDSIRVYFESAEDRIAFFEKIEVPNPGRTRGIWYPWSPLKRSTELTEAVDGIPAGKYPVYVISKGRTPSGGWSVSETVIAVPGAGPASISSSTI